MLDNRGKCGRILLADAGVAHPVERHLAKVEVASSSLVARSNFLFYQECIPSGIQFLFPYLFLLSTSVNAVQRFFCTYFRSFFDETGAFVIFVKIVSIFRNSLLHLLLSACMTSLLGWFFR